MKDVGKGEAGRGLGGSGGRPFDAAGSSFIFSSNAVSLFALSVLIVYFQLCLLFSFVFMMFYIEIGNISVNNS